MWAENLYFTHFQQIMCTRTMRIIFNWWEFAFCDKARIFSQFYSLDWNNRYYFEKREFNQNKWISNESFAEIIQTVDNERIDGRIVEELNDFNGWKSIYQVNFSTVVFGVEKNQGKIKLHRRM